MKTTANGNALRANPNDHETLPNELRVCTAVEAGLTSGEKFSPTLSQPVCAGMPRMKHCLASDFPLRMGSEESFRLVHSFLQEIGYTEAWLLERFGVPSLHFLLYPRGQRGEEFQRRYQGPGTTPLMARLLMGGFAATPEELKSHVPAPIRDALSDLRMLTPTPNDRARFFCPALVYPALDFFVAADRGVFFEGLPGYPGLDYVMSGTEHICRDYIESVPDTPCATVLEIGTGAGLGALRASRTAGHVWATDITSRAVAYAEFNRRLNLVSNITVIQGDLFTPVEGLMFDRIACNPPFEPPLKSGYVFSVGGEDGEQIMRRVIEAAPAHLKPGGRLHMQVIGTNREGDDFDARIRRYLGKAAGECDIALFVRRRMELSEYAVQQILGENDDAWKLDEWIAFYEKLQALEVVHGHLVIQRAVQSRTVFHTVRNLGPHTNLDQMEWLLDWETRSTVPTHSELLFGSRPAVASCSHLDVRHGVRDGKLSPESYTLETEAPFKVELTVEPWIGAMVSFCDGQRTAAELLECVRSCGALPGEDGAIEFARVLHALVAYNILQLEGFNPPGPQSSRAGYLPPNHANFSADSRF